MWRSITCSDIWSVWIGKFFCGLNWTVHEAFEEWKLFCPIPTTKYCGSMLRMEVFWALKDVFLNDELDVTMLGKGDRTMYVVSNFTKKWVSWRDNSLFKSLRPKNILRIWVMQFKTCVIKNYMEKGIIHEMTVCKALVLIPGTRTELRMILESVMRRLKHWKILN
jgi:hypothetical protein